MIFAMNRSIVLTVFVFLVAAPIILLIAVGYATSPNEIFASRGAILLWVNAALIVLCWRPALRAIHKITFASAWWFPWLDGEWRAEIRSNWPKVKRTFEAARGDAPPYDALTQETLDELVTYASVEIRSSLFDMSIVIAPEGTDRISRTRFVRPRWAKPDRPELSYVFEQEDNGTISITDARAHLGAGLIKYDAERDQLDGEYWTHRRSDVGLNTAGTILIRRVLKQASADGDRTSN